MEKEKIKKLDDSKLGSVAGGVVVSQAGQHSLGKQWVSKDGRLALDYDKYGEEQKKQYKFVDVSDKPFIVLDPHGKARAVFNTQEEAENFEQSEGYYWY